jgi:hypothetical protein
VTSSSSPAAAFGCFARGSTYQQCWQAKARHQESRLGHLARQLHALRSGLFRPRAENLATPRQPIRHEVVTHVLGTFRYLCLRAAQLIYGGRGGIRTHGTLAGTPVFKTGSLNHSDTLPSFQIVWLFGRLVKRRRACLWLRAAHRVNYRGESSANRGGRGRVKGIRVASVALRQALQ